MLQIRHLVDDERFSLVRTLRSAASNGVRIAPHAHSWPQLIVPVRGVLSVWTSVGSWVIPPGCAVWAPAGISHGWRSVGALELRLLAESSRSTPHTPATLASTAGISLRTLERRFSAETGMSLGRWLRHARMIDSLLALADGSSVAAAARRAGYSTSSAFVAAFSSIFGATPGQFFLVGDGEPGAG